MDRSRSTRARSGKGFTLLEILIAFAIVALVMTALFRSFQVGVEHERRAERATFRLLEARSVLAQFEASRPLEARQSGTLSGGETWHLESAALAPEEGPVRATQVILRVRDGERDVLTLGTVVLSSQ